MNSASLPALAYFLHFLFFQTCMIVILLIWPLCIKTFTNCECVYSRVPQNCPRTYNLMSFDPDGDKVRCRYGNIRHLECSSCRQPSGFNLDQVSWKISFLIHRTILDWCFALLNSYMFTLLGLLHVTIPLLQCQHKSSWIWDGGGGLPTREHHPDLQWWIPILQGPTDCEEKETNLQLISSNHN